MCGLCGVVGPTPRAGLDALPAMTRALAHRGPDDHGVWQASFQHRGEDWSVGLGHRRLSILDLSAAGHQPFADPTGQVTLSYNGEIYNFRALRDELRDAGREFRSDCDTEVLLQGYLELGLSVFERLQGMFACAIWDAREQRLVLARDRLGIKPLYYHCDDDLLLFGSELSALRAHPHFRAAIDRASLGTYLRGGYVAGPGSIYEKTWRVMPGELVIWQHGALEHRSYYDLLAPEPSVPATFEAAVDGLEDRLVDAIRARLVADVPLGAFLSGGIDSSTVVALMRECASGPVRTFSIGFEETAYDESAHARAVADHLETEHTELRVTQAQARDVALALPELYDEPFADSSAIPTTLLSRMTREHVTVALSGDGGDELLLGYRHYGKLARLGRLHALPGPLRRLLRAVGPLLPREDLRNGVRHLQAGSELELAARLTCHFPSELLLRACGPAGARIPEPYVEAFSGAPSDDLLRRASYGDARLYLPDDILTKVDRASMAIGLEARVPLLDPRVVRFALSLPRHLAVREGRTKAPLRAILHRRVPPELVERPKQGFAIPIETLLRDELVAWREKYLAPARLAEEGLFAADAIPDLLGSTRVSGVPGRDRLWYLLCFERWFARHHRGET